MWFLHQLRALRDGGLPLSFDDVVDGIDQASANAKMDITRGEVNEETVLRFIADACRKRVAKNEADYDRLKSSVMSSEIYKTVASAQPQS